MFLSKFIFSLYILSDENAKPTKNVTAFRWLTASNDIKNAEKRKKEKIFINKERIRDYYMIYFWNYLPTSPLMTA